MIIAAENLAAAALYFKRFAVGALVHSRVFLVCAHLDAVEGAVILMVVVILALLDGTFNAFVCKAVIHVFPFLSFCTVLTRTF